MSLSNQSSVIYSNEIFKQYLLQIATGIVWKDTNRANENEPEDLASIYQSELFVVANRGLLNFEVVKSFPRVVLLNAAVPETEVELYATDKRRIPTYMRDTIVAEYQKALSSTNPISGRPGYLNTLTGEYETIYTESNNYYRMLMGLPNTEDTNYIYNTDSRWPTNIPIHDLPYIDRIEMEREGVLDTIIAANPDKEYLKHLGKRYIEPFNARIADRFEILYSEDSSSDLLNSDFIDAYNSARHVVLSVYYNNSFRKTNNLYDNFLAMCILFMALQIMMSKYLEVDITRDFYDAESLKLVYDSYGVPFYNDIPLDYHRKIVKNMNKLISYKGSSQVFFDLFNIFDLGSMDIYSYFLTKVHLLDANGIPMFNIKKDDEGNDMYDEEGHPILDESNYMLRFSQVKIYDDPSLSISDEANNVAYNTLTENDPYWIEDEELIRKLANENFNYLESKYIGIQTVFDLMKITFENAYVFRLITDQKELTDKMTFRWSEIGIDCSLYDIFIYLASIYCRYYGYAGQITNHIPAIMDTLGFNFEKAAEILKSRASNNKIIDDNKELMDLIMGIDLSNIYNTNLAFDSIVKIRDIIIDGYVNAKTIEEFYAYRDLYKSLMVSKEVTEVYQDKNGNIYSTFTDILADEFPELMQRYLLIEDEDIENELLIVINQIETLLTSLRYLPLSLGVGISALIEPLFKILKFFKSAKAELVDYDIIYNITMRGISFIKLMDIVKSCLTETKVNDDTYFIDIIQLMQELLSFKQECQLVAEGFSNPLNKARLYDYIDTMTDSLKLITEIVDYIFKDEVWYIDFIKNIKTSSNFIDKLLLNDSSDVVLTALDILEARYTGLTKDYILTLTDTLIINQKGPELFYILEYLTIADKLRCIITSFDKRQISSNSLFEEELIQLIFESFKDNDQLSDKLRDLFYTLGIDDIDMSIDKIRLTNETYEKFKTTNPLYDKLKQVMETFNTTDILIKEDLLTSIMLISYLFSDGHFTDKLKFIKRIIYNNDNQTMISIIKSLYNAGSNLHDGSTMKDYLFEHDLDGNMHPVA